MSSRVFAIYHRAETFGGSFNSVTDVLSRVDPQRFAVVCGVPGPGNVADTFRGMGLPVLPFQEHRGGKSARYLWAVMTAARMLRRERVQMVYIADHVTWRSSALLAARLAGAASVVHLRAPLGDIAFDTEIMRATMIVGNSEATVSALRAHRPPEQVRVVPNFINFSAFDSPTDIRATFFPARPPVVGFVGVFRPEKGIETFFDMARLVHEQRPDVRFLAVGGESSVDNIGWFERMRAYAYALDLADAVLFTGPRTDIANLMASMDVVVVPSLNEGFGRVLVEANAVGTLVVGANAAGIPEVVDPGVSGLLAPPGDARAFADAVTRVLDDLAWRDRARRALPPLTRARFSPDTQMDKLQRAWDDALVYKRRA